MADSFSSLGDYLGTVKGFFIFFIYCMFAKYEGMCLSPLFQFLLVHFLFSAIFMSFGKVRNGFSVVLGVFEKVSEKILETGLKASTLFFNGDEGRFPETTALNHGRGIPLMPVGF